MVVAAGGWGHICQLPWRKHTSPILHFSFQPHPKPGCLSEARSPPLIPSWIPPCSHKHSPRPFWPLSLTLGPAQLLNTPPALPRSFTSAAAAACLDFPSPLCLVSASAGSVGLGKTFGRPGQSQSPSRDDCPLSGPPASSSSVAGPVCVPRSHL